MGKEVPRSFERLRSGEHLQIPVYTNVAAANAAGVTATKYPRRFIFLLTGIGGSASCVAFSDGTVWKAIPFAGNAT